MRILMLHNRYLQHGGEDVTVEEQAALLRSYGHEVTLLLWDNQTIAQQSLWRTAVETLWSSTAHRLVKEHLASHAYDVVHIHNFFPLASPAVHYAAQSRGIPVIQTLHNYRLMCLNGLFLRAGEPCETCLRRSWPWPGVIHRCYRNSLPGSVVVAAMLATHRVLKTWQRQVDLFVALSQFARKKFLQAGLPPSRLKVLPHFVYPDPGTDKTPQERECVLFIGRLEKAKGIDVLLTAWQALQSQIPLCVIGDGPLASTVRAAEKKAHVRWLGWRPREEVIAYLQRAHLLVVPSRAYETFGRVVVEAFAAGTPVLVSNHGALAELVTPEKTGWHFPSANSAALAERLRQALHDPTALRRMGETARRVYETHYTARQGYMRLMEAYQQAINLHQERKKEPLH